MKKWFIALPRFTRAMVIYVVASLAVFLFIWQQFNARVEDPNFNGSGRQLGVVILISLAIFVLAILCDLVVTKKINAGKRLIAAFLVGIFSTLAPGQAVADGGPKVELRKVIVKIAFDQGGKPDLTNIESQLPNELSAQDKAKLVAKVGEMVTATSLKPGTAILVGPEGSTATPAEIKAATTAAQTAIKRALEEVNGAAEPGYSGGPQANLIGLILLIIAIALVASGLYLLYLWAKYLMPGGRAAGGTGDVNGANLIGLTSYTGSYPDLPGVMLSTSFTGTSEAGVTLQATPDMAVPFVNAFTVTFTAGGTGTNGIPGTLTITISGQEPRNLPVTVPIISGSDISQLVPLAVLVDTNPPPNQFFRLAK